MLHVKFDNTWCNGFREKLFQEVKHVTFKNWSKVTLVNRK